MFNEERERMSPKERETRDRNVDETKRKKERKKETDRQGRTVSSHLCEVGPPLNAKRRQNSLNRLCCNFFICASLIF